MSHAAPSVVSRVQFTCSWVRRCSCFVLLADAAFGLVFVALLFALLRLLLLALFSG